MNRRALIQHFESGVRVALSRDGLTHDDIKMALYSALALVEADEGILPEVPCRVVPDVIKLRLNGGGDG